MNPAPSDTRPHGLLIANLLAQIAFGLLAIILPAVILTVKIVRRRNAAAREQELAALRCVGPDRRSRLRPCMQCPQQQEEGRLPLRHDKPCHASRPTTPAVWSNSPGASARA